MKDSKSKVEIELGTLVVSKSGRDSGAYYIIVRYADMRDHVMCVDGKYRKLTNPKKKRIKHLKMIASLPLIQRKLLSNHKLFDSEIFSAIKTVRDSIEVEVETVVDVQQS
jgi:ribosomal protein L14E/L6E/L27E